MSSMPRYVSILWFLIGISQFTSISRSQVMVKPEQGEVGLSKHPWQYGVYVQGGLPPEYVISYSGDSNFPVPLTLDLYSAGIVVGKQTRRFDSFVPLRGRGEVLLEVVPFWLAQYPAQNLTVHYNKSDTTYSLGHWSGQNVHGVSITPFLLRWNFSQRDSARIVPWAQFGGGLLWTNQKFPLTFAAPATSALNFTPQLGAGVNIFNKPKHSVNFAVKAIHYSNAGMSSYNPGLQVTLQFSAGYSWWK